MGKFTVSLSIQLDLVWQEMLSGKEKRKGRIHVYMYALGLSPKYKFWLTLILSSVVFRFMLLLFAGHLCCKNLLRQTLKDSYSSLTWSNSRKVGWVNQPEVSSILSLVFSTYLVYELHHRLHSSTAQQGGFILLENSSSWSHSQSQPKPTARVVSVGYFQQKCEVCFCKWITVSWTPWCIIVYFCCLAGLPGNRIFTN